IAFRHHWLKLHRLGEPGPLSDFSLCAVAAKAGKFARPVSDRQSVLSTLAHGCHLDSALYARYLRDLALNTGVTRVDARLGFAAQRECGAIEALVLQNGTRIGADFFIDCSGALIGDTLKVPFEDWSRWLPCDRVLALSTHADRDLPPYTQCMAREAGWQWRIPLQHRTGTGYVYCSRFLSDDDVAGALLSSVGGADRSELRSASFTSGRRSNVWENNSVAIGRAACTFEPLEGATMHAIQVGLTRLLALFPDRSFAAGEREEYNRLMASELERMRDFLILHYKATQRGDTPFWQYCRERELPELLAHKVRLFQSRGRVVLYDEETYAENSWASVCIGQGMIPERYDPLVDTLDTEQVRTQLKRMRAAIRTGTDSMPSHSALIARFCAARPETLA
ncbi:MAG TPA: tryptophan halogenase family protein, partial [Rhizomicrobium sp.]